MHRATSASRPRAVAPDGGFSLIEMIVAIALMSIVMSLGILAMKSFLMSNRESGTAFDIRSALRNASELSVSEGRTYCVYFTATSWTTYRSDCTVAADRVGGSQQVSDPSITLSAFSFAPPGAAIPGQTTACATTNRCAYFYPRGTALGGGLQVVRAGKTYTINGEGLTSRVSMV
jgi:prepilin-type N-terminal cleavage/methylation domain-containing protein